MSRFPIITLVAVLTVSAGLSHAAEKSSALADRQHLALTVYGNGLTLVKDQREADLLLGINSLTVAGASPQMITDSLDLDFGTNVRLLSRTLRPANLNPQSLLEAHLGKPVKLVQRHPVSGVETVLDATLISVRGGVIARIGGRLISNPEGRWSFPALPTHLNAEPVLAVNAESTAAGRTPFTLRYLTGGLTWRAAYTAEWNRATGSIRLVALAALKNATALDFDRAQVQVVAGHVRRVSQPRPQVRATMALKAERAMAADAPAAAPLRQALAGYHLYTLPRLIDLKRGEEVQASLLNPLTAQVSRELVSEGHPAVYGRVNGGAGAPTHPAIRLTFTNPKTDDAQPLPSGILRLYGRDRDGATQFLGEDRLGDIPVGGKVMLTAGNAFDVTIKRKQTDFRRDARNLFEAAYEIELVNGKDSAETIKVIEAVPGDWQIIDSDRAHTREANRAVWRITIPPSTTQNFTYRVRVRT